MSEHFERALSDWREARAEYERFLDAQYEQAAETCREALLNDRGRAQHVDPRSLFMGPAVRAYAYASEELVDFWEQHPRVTFVEFERRWLRDRDAERDADAIARSSAGFDTEPW